MGSWDYGMLDNDTAADAVWDIEQFLRKKAKVDAKDILQYVVKSIRGKNVNELRWHGGTAAEVLGVAEWLLDHDYSIKRIKPIVKKYIRWALDPEVLEDWKKPKERKAALKNFAERAKIKL